MRKTDKLSFARLFGIFLAVFFLLGAAFSTRIEIIALNEGNSQIAPLSVDLFSKASIDERNAPFFSNSSPNGTVVAETNRTRVFYYASSPGYSINPQISSYPEIDLSGGERVRLVVKMRQIKASLRATILDFSTNAPIEGVLFEMKDSSGNLLHSSRSNSSGGVFYSRTGLLRNATATFSLDGYYPETRRQDFVYNSLSSASVRLKRLNGTNVSAFELSQINRSNYPKVDESVERAELNRTKGLESSLRDIFPIRGNSTDKAQYSRNSVAIAARLLVSLGNHSGYLGSQMRDIARDFNNSFERTSAYERALSGRGKVMRFIAGGDDKTAKKLEESVSENRVILEKLRALKENCDCSQETKAFLSDKILTIEQEQMRLLSLAGKEKSEKGLFGWFWK